MWNMTTEREEGSIGGDKQERHAEGICGTRLLKERKAPLEVTSKRHAEGICGTRLVKERKAPLEVTSKRDTQKTYVEHDY